MPPIAVLAGSALLAASLLLPAVPAFAGDRAAFAPLGFSPDGRYFAFEEYGVQDGSGFPFSTIYAIDLPADRWIAGAPFAARIDSEDASLATARAEAKRRAGPALEALPIEVPAELLALNGDGETADGRTLAFGTPGYGLEPPQDVRTLSLETFPATTPGTRCADYTSAPTLGFALLLDGAEIHRDATLPRSRGCALDYRIYGVVAPFQAGLRIPGAVVIVSVYPFGFEGPDRRFIAIPIDQP